jgi:hypothetical protein
MYTGMYLSRFVAFKYMEYIFTDTSYSCEYVHLARFVTLTVYVYTYLVRFVILSYMPVRTYFER